MRFCVLHKELRSYFTKLCYMQYIDQYILPYIVLFSFDIDKYKSVLTIIHQGAKSEYIFDELLSEPKMEVIIDIKFYFS